MWTYTIRKAKPPPSRGIEPGNRVSPHSRAFGNAPNLFSPGRGFAAAGRSDHAQPREMSGLDGPKQTDGCCVLTIYRDGEHKGEEEAEAGCPALIVAVLGGKAPGGPKKREAAITVQTEKVREADAHGLVVANGRIQPVFQVKISPEVSGEIIELPVKEGTRSRRAICCSRSSRTCTLRSAFVRGKLQGRPGGKGHSRGEREEGGDRSASGRGAA